MTATCATSATAAPGFVRVQCEGELAIIHIEHPPVNSLAWPVRAALLAAIEQAERQPAIRAILVTGTARAFVAGADIPELARPAVAPILVDVLARLEACSKLVIAVISGHALGGGFELALACHYRCASADAQLGLPEVKLGLLPGAGGTQRLPRLIPTETALDMMLSGAPIDALRAHDLGIIDWVIQSGDVLEAGKSYARELLTGNSAPRCLRDAAAPYLIGVNVERQLLERHARTLRGLASGPRIIECVRAAATLPFDSGIALSRRLFEECRSSDASRALRHLFLAERSAARMTAGARAVEQVAVIGAGTMGVGIAIALADAGLPVTLVDIDRDGLSRAHARVQSHYLAQVARGRCSAVESGLRVGRISFAAGYDAVSRCDFVIEAVFENLDVKHSVFKALDAILPHGAVLASNTSYLDIDGIASATSRPKYVVGMHFFSPAHVMKLIEVVRGAATDPDVIATSVALARRLKKIPVVVGNATGFVGNRMFQAYCRESQLLLLEGATPWQIDAALEGFGMAMGPCAVLDLAGLDVGYRARRERAGSSQDPRYFRVADRLVEQQRLGQKSGRGHYLYGKGGAREPDAAVLDLIDAEAVALAITPRQIDDEEIVERCVLALVVNGAALLSEGIAANAADIDVIWVNGYGFPRFRGGPMCYADALGTVRVLARVEDLASRHGKCYWAPPLLLRELGSIGNTFGCDQ